MMETPSADKSDLILGVDGELVMQAAIPTQKIVCIYVKQEGLDTMRTRERSKQKSHPCEARSTDGEQFDRDNTDCLQATLSLTQCSHVSFQRRAELKVDSSSDGHRRNDDGQLEKR